MRIGKTHKFYSGATLKQSNSKVMRNSNFSKRDTSMNMDNSRLGTGNGMGSNRSGASPYASGGVLHRNSFLQTPSKMDGRPQTGKPKAPEVSVFDFKGDILTKL